MTRHKPPDPLQPTYADAVEFASHLFAHCANELQALPATKTIAKLFGVSPTRLGGAAWRLREQRAAVTREQWEARQRNEPDVAEGGYGETTGYSHRPRYMGD